MRLVLVTVYLLYRRPRQVVLLSLSTRATLAIYYRARSLTTLDSPNILIKELVGLLYSVMLLLN